MAAGSSETIRLVPVQLPPVTTLHYQGPPPYPHPEVTAGTPDEQYQQYVRQQETEHQQREAALAEEKSRSTENQGALGKLGMFAKAMGHTVQKASSQFHGSVEAKVRQETQARDRKRWQDNFPEQAAAGSEWIADYSCKVMNNGKAFAGSVVVTTTHVNWLGPDLKDSYPLLDILSIVRSVDLPTVDNGPPYILPVPALHVIPTCLQIFTCKMQVVQFLEFKNATTMVAEHTTGSLSGTPLERFYNFLDHSWRRAGGGPRKDVEYMTPPQM